MMRLRRSTVLLLAVCLWAAGCSDKNEGGKGNPPASPPAAAQTKATKTGYTCPMHPEVTSDKPGKCPKCGMDLVPKK